MSTFSPSARVIEMDKIISRYAKFLETVSRNDKERPYLESKLLSAKLIREKLVAMKAFAKAQLLIAEMDVLVAENSLKNACEQLAKSKNELDEKTEKPKSHKSKDRGKESEKSQSRQRKSKSPIEDKENISKNTTHSDTIKNIHKSQSKEETKSKKRRGSNSSHSNSKKAKLSPEIKTSKSHKKSSKSKTLSSPIESSKNDFDKAMEMDDNLLSIIGDDEDTVLIEDLSDKQGTNTLNGLQVSELPQHRSEISKIKIMFEEDDMKMFRNVKTEPSDLNTSTDKLVNGLFKDILEAKMREMSKGSSDSSTPSMLRELLEQC